MMRRRALLKLLGITATISVAWPLRPNAQQRSQPALVGIFTATDLTGKSFVPAETDAFLQAMRDLGYVEGQTISYAYGAGIPVRHSFITMAASRSAVACFKDLSTAPTPCCFRSTASVTPLCRW
jgi:hypothetical protein